MTYSRPALGGNAEGPQEIQMLTLYDLDITELEVRLELASVLPADCWVDSCGAQACSGNGCPANAS